MLKFSRQVDYALQLVIALVAINKNKPLSIKRFSEESNISFLFLQRIAKRLREAGIVTATMGASGGYTLSKPAESISVKDIMVAIEGSCGISECAIGECDRLSDCSIKRKISLINKTIVNHLESVKISHMAS